MSQASHNNIPIEEEYLARYYKDDIVILTNGSTRDT